MTPTPKMRRGSRKTSSSPKKGGQAQPGMKADVRLSPQRVKAYKECKHKQKREHPELKSVTYSSKMSGHEIGQLVRKLKARLGIGSNETLSPSQNAMQRVLSYDTMSFMEKLLCRWPRPSELSQVAKRIVTGEPIIHYYTAALHVHGSDLPLLVETYGAFFSRLTRKHHLFYVWMADQRSKHEKKTSKQGSTARCVLVYGIVKKDVQNAVVDVLKKIKQLQNDGKEVYASANAYWVSVRALEDSENMMGHEAFLESPEGRPQVEMVLPNLRIRNPEIYPIPQVYVEEHGASMVWNTFAYLVSRWQDAIMHDDAQAYSSLTNEVNENWQMYAWEQSYHYNPALRTVYEHVGYIDHAFRHAEFLIDEIQDNAGGIKDRIVSGTKDLDIPRFAFDNPFYRAMLYVLYNSGAYGNILPQEAFEQLMRRVASVFPSSTEGERKSLLMNFSNGNFTSYSGGGKRTTTTRKNRSKLGNGKGAAATKKKGATSSRGK